MKKRILFVVDKPDWAYEFMVKSWLPFLMDDYDCYLVYQTDYAITRSSNTNFLFQFFRNNFIKLRSFFKNSDLKLLHPDGYFYSESKNKPLYKFINNKGEKKTIEERINHFYAIFEMAYYFQYTSHMGFTADKSIVGLYTDAFPHDGPTIDLKRNIDRSKLNRQQFYDIYIAPYDYLIVGGGSLYNDYRKVTDKVFYASGIFGEENFVENKNVGENEGLVIGWTGTPDRPMKGFREFIEPVIDELISEGKNIRLKTKFSGPYEDLYSFYSDVDLVVIASIADAGPSMFAEASLSSVPAISTKIGMPLLTIEDNINGMFIDRSKESLKSAILKLYEDRELLKNFSKRIRRDYLERLGNKKSVENILKLLK